MTHNLKVEITQKLIGDPQGHVVEKNFIYSLLQNTDFLHILIVVNILLKQLNGKEICLSSLDEINELIKKYLTKE